MNEKKQENQRLLIVDDSKVIRVTARKILRDYFETVEAVDGEDAWEILGSETPFSLVVSDLTMPNLNGFGLLQRIRNSPLPHIRDLPVVIITGANDTETTMEQARQSGATDFIGKPFDAIQLLARTQAYADSHTLTTTLRRENTSLEEQSAIDPLTGLSSEIAFMERGYQQLSHAIRNASSLGIFRIEIDDYGRLFTQHGAELAETVVCAMANALTTVIRQEDTAARTGTARFSLLLPGMNIIGIRALAERINSEFSMRRFSSGGAPISATVSIGAGLPDISKDTRFDELLAIADRRLSQASKSGGNRIILEDTLPVTGTAAAPESPTGPAEGAVPGQAAKQDARHAVLPLDVDSLEVEEIELFAPGYPFDIFRTNDKAPKESLADTPVSATDTPAGTVPDNVVAISKVTQPSMHAHSDASRDKASFYAADVTDDGKLAPAVTLASHPLEEDIVISAPFTADSQSHPGVRQQQSVTHSNDASSGDKQTNNDPETGDDDRGSVAAEMEIRRPGLLKRVFTLFRRSRR